MVSVIAAALLLGAGQPDAEGLEFFEKEVRPILVEHCYRCHSTNSKRVKGGLFLDSAAGWMRGGDSGPAIVPGEPGESLLIEAVRYGNEDLQMPPRGKLSEKEVQVLVRWVRMGAPDPRAGDAQRPAKDAIDRSAIEEGREFWAFQPPRPPPVPEVRRADWPRDDIDRFVLARLEAKGLEPVGDADRRTLIRRATFDVIGLPPTPAEIEAFLSDPSPDAFAEVVDRLLASPRFGERWGRHWLDVARYAESTGKTRNYAYPHAWRYRDYVIDSFNRDKPYDRFVAEQVAGDLLPASSARERDEAKIATGFLALGTKDLNERNRLQFTMDNVDEQIDTLSRSVLALTVSCARCHDHKFDPIPTRDYYALAGIFKSTEILSGLSSRRGGNRGYRSGQLIALESIDSAKEDDGERTEAAKKAAEARSAQVATLERRIERAQRELRRLQQLRRSPRRNPDSQNAPGRGRRGARSDQGARSEERLTPAQIGARVRGARRQLTRLTAQLEELKSTEDLGPVAMGVRDHDRPENCPVMIRGDVRNPGPVVERGFIQVLSHAGTPPAPPDASGRAELARWLTSRDNPLTARVFVNRVWHHLFGQGFVRTVDNFGRMGERPSHPGLLDHLAARFMDEGWSVKKLIRTILLSRTYGLSAAQQDAAYDVDPDNRLLWRMNPRRLEVEALRDAMLAVSGELVREPLEGSLVMHLGGGEVGRGANAAALRSPSSHRSVYLPILRGMVPNMLEVFDFAEPSMVKGRRDVTTVATQALYMMNSPFVIEQSRHAAERVLAARGLDDEGRVRLAYEWALARPPRAEETERAVAYVVSRLEEGPGTGSTRRSGGARGRAIEAWSGFCQALFASAEFRYLY